MKYYWRWTLLMMLALALVACSSKAEDSSDATLAGPDLTSGEKLNVVATTTLIADVVQQVGGERIELHTLLPVGVDPHSYQPTPQDLRAMNDAHVIFVNGLGLEEAMSTTLDDFAAKTIAVNANVEPLSLQDEADEEHHDEEEHDEEGHTDHGGLDPHTWLSVANVIAWTQTIADSLGELDPRYAQEFTAAAEVYVQELEALKTEIVQQVETLPQAQRLLVTDHNEWGYFAHDYGFEVIGAVIPGFSTLVEPSAQELAALQDQIESHQIKAIFVGDTVNSDVATQLSHDLGVPLITLYSASLSTAEGPAASYLDLMRYNVSAIVEALQTP